MLYLLCVAAGLCVGGIVAWLVSDKRVRKELAGKLQESERRANTAGGRASGLEGMVAELQRQSQIAAKDFKTLRDTLAKEQEARARAETQRDETAQRFKEEKRLLDEAKSKLAEAFKALAGDTLEHSNAAFIKLANETFEKVLAVATGDLGKRQEAIKGLVKPLSDSLKQFEEHVRGIEKNRHEAYAGLTEQLKTLSTAQQQLQRETGNLATALQTPQVVGSWGEITLERVLELSGMSEHCDFTRQVSVTTEDGRLQPDVVVHLPGNHEIVIDAKATFDAYHNAVSAASEEERRQALDQHASQVRSHMRTLASKHYWQQFEGAPEFVVMFVPGESFFAAAVDTDRRLLEDALDRRVVLATPTTLFAALLAVAHAWRQEQAAKGAQQIRDLGRELYGRMRILAEHLSNIGKGLEKANAAYNKAVGSVEARVLPAARRFKDLGAASGAEIPLIQPTATAPRALTAPEAEADTGQSPA